MFKFILYNKVNKNKNEYSAWELTTPFRLYETGFDKVKCSHSVVPIPVRWQSSVVDPFCTLIAKVLENNVHILYTVIAFYDNVPAN